MPFTPELIAELEVLSQFNLDNHQEGIKVSSDASPPWSPLPSACMTKGSPTNPMAVTSPALVTMLLRASGFC